MRAPAPTSEGELMDLDVILGAAVALFLLVYMTYALVWPEKL
jgi:K+-transporting ATPase KdpF subunit